MEDFFYHTFGLSPALFNWLILPLLIFLARISDVTLSTIRIVFVMSGRRNLAPVLGFFESLIWLIAISQIIKNISSPLSYVAYAGGFATGTYVGMFIEEKLALGKVNGSGHYPPGSHGTPTVSAKFPLWLNERSGRGQTGKGESHLFSGGTPRSSGIYLYD
jgi:hypothetical protein